MFSISYQKICSGWLKETWVTENFGVTSVFSVLIAILSIIIIGLTTNVCIFQDHEFYVNATSKSLLLIWRPFSWKFFARVGP